MSQVRTNSIVPVGGVPSGASGGGFIQVVTAVKSDFTDQGTAGNTFYDISGLSVSITPRSSSSKVFIQVAAHYGSGQNGGIRLVRGSTEIAIGDVYSSRARMSASANTEGSIEPASIVVNFVDSPATTSAVTYKVQGLAHANGGGSGGSFKINSGWGNGTNADYPQTISSITVFEISG